MILYTGILVKKTSILRRDWLAVFSSLYRKKPLNVLMSNYQNQQA